MYAPLPVTSGSRLNLTISVPIFASRPMERMLAQYVSLQRIRSRLVRVEQALEIKKRRGVGKDLDGVVAGAARIVRHRSVGAACHAADDLIERAVAAAGIQPHLLPRFAGFSGERAAVAGGFGYADFIVEPARAANPFNILRKARGLIRFTGSGIENKNMLHDGNNLLYPSS